MRTTTRRNVRDVPRARTAVLLVVLDVLLAGALALRASMDTAAWYFPIDVADKR